MNIKNNKELINLLNEAAFKGNEYFDRLLAGIFRFNKFNQVYEKVSAQKGFDFIDEVIGLLKLNIEFGEKQIKRIPAKGPVIVVANHPLGGIERLLLIKYLSKIRPDIKVLGDPLIQQVEPLAGYFISGTIKNNANKDKPTQNLAPEASRHIENGGMLCLFPSGSGSTYHPFYGFTDKVWQLQIIRFIKSAQIPVLPVYFQAKRGFQAVSRLKANPFFSGIKTPAKRLSIKIRIGNPVNVVTQNKFEDEYRFGRYLRAKVFGMESNVKVKSFFKTFIKPEAKPEIISDAVPVKKILKEIRSIEKEFTLFTLKNYSVFCAPTSRIPEILTEIGRLREITFREVGEGTNRKIDIDEYDLYYYQLFIWDNDENRVVGAYRIGPGKEIIAQYGKQGFYISTLFGLADELIPVLSESLELGRSFVVSDYQRKPLPLFLLWKGILYFLLKNPEYRYLIGPASISNNYSTVSKELMVRFFTKYHFEKKLTVSVFPLNEFKPARNNSLVKTLLESTENSVELLDKTVSDLEEQNFGVPVLLKKYIQLNAKILGFNVDPDFSNSLDALIFLDAFNIPEQVIDSLSKDLNDGIAVERFHTKKE